MGWTCPNKYTLDCGCECEDWEYDVDRPFMCYTDYETRITNRCTLHQDEHNARMKLEEEYIEKRRQDRLKRDEALAVYLKTLSDIEDTELVPLQYAVDKFKQVMKNTNSKSWIHDYLRSRFHEALMIRQRRPRCRVYCSKSKVDAMDFKHVWDLQNTQYMPTRP